MKFITNRMLGFLLKNNVITNDVDVIAFYKYGIEISISSFFVIFIVISLGLIMNSPLSAIIYLVLFMFVRSLTGGYHANTYLKCNILTSSGFLFVYYTSKILNPYTSKIIIIIIYMFSIIIVSAFSPIENPNKPIPQEKRPIFKASGIVLNVILMIVNLLVTNTEIIYDDILTFTVFFITILILVVILNTRKDVK